LGNACYDEDSRICFSLLSHLLVKSRLKYTDVIMLVINSWSENLSLTLWEELRHQVFEKPIQRKIFALRKKMWQRDWQLHNPEFHTTYSLPGWPYQEPWFGGGVKRHRRGEKMDNDTTLKNWREISLPKTGHEWEGNIKMTEKQTVSNKTAYSTGSPLVILLDSSENGNKYLSSISSGKFYD
jgi:hypothetical protein